MSISSVGSSGAVPSVAAGQFTGGQIAGAPAGSMAPDSMSNPQQDQPSARFTDGVYGVRPNPHKKKKDHGLAIAIGVAALTLLGALALIATHGRLWGKGSKPESSDNARLKDGAKLTKGIIKGAESPGGHHESHDTDDSASVQHEDAEEEEHEADGD